MIISNLRAYRAQAPQGAWAFFNCNEVTSLYKAGRRECALSMPSNMGYNLLKRNDNDYHYK